MQRLRGDEGATAVLMAVLMVALLGVGAIVVDAGALYAERRQLQNGADAAALAVVLDCPRPAGCDTGTGGGTVAGRYANQNALDGAATVQHVCGVGANLTPCSPVSGMGPWDCRPLPAGPLGAANYVQVRTQTRTTTGANLVPPLLARVLNPGYTGATGRACARASWGAPAAMTSGLAITISHCAWGAATGGGTSFAPPPPYPPNPATSVERVLKLHSNVTATCPGGGQSSSDRPGAFGWLSDENGNCTSNVDLATLEVGTDPGNNVSHPCQTAFDNAMLPPRDVLYIPIYESAVANGMNTTYTIRGFAAFVLTGAKLPSYNRASWLSGQQFCTGSEKCLYGFFTQELVPADGVIGNAPLMGVTVFQMSG